MAKLSDKELAFIAENPYVATVTMLRPDGSPHETVVWVDVESGTVSFNTAVGRAKERHLRADPRVSLTVVDPQNAYHWVSVSGRAELTKDGADDQIDKLAKKYLGEDTYPGRSPDDERISVKITPEKVDSAGFDD